MQFCQEIPYVIVRMIPHGGMGDAPNEESFAGGKIISTPIHKLLLQSETALRLEDPKEPHDPRNDRALRGEGTT